MSGIAVSWVLSSTPEMFPISSARFSILMMIMMMMTRKMKSGGTSSAYAMRVKMIALLCFLI